MSKKAREPTIGDSFPLSIHGTVVATSRLADGKRVLIRFALENLGRDGKNSGALEFTDAGYVLEFICYHGKPFQVRYRDGGWGDDDGDAPVEPTPPTELLDA